MLEKYCIASILEVKTKTKILIELCIYISQLWTTAVNLIQAELD